MSAREDMNTVSAAHAFQKSGVPHPAGLLTAMHARAVHTRTSLDIIIGRGWLGAPIIEPAMGNAPDKPVLAVRKGYEGLDTAAIRGLLEKSFCKRVADGFFGLPVSQIIVAEDYSGIAIIKSVAGVPYLDKLAVAPEGQGKGMGQALWERIREDFPELVWRASAKNPANGWYLRISDGAINTGEWIVYWCGMDADAAKALVSAVASMPKTMI